MKILRISDLHVYNYIETNTKTYAITAYRVQVIPILLRFQNKVPALSSKLGKKGKWISLEEITNLPLTKPAREVLTKPMQLVL